MTAIQVISCHRATRAVTELETTDPRPAALLDTAWPRVQDVSLTEAEMFERFSELAAAVLTHYGYPVTRTGRPPIDATLAAAVRMTRIPESMGCRWCGADRESHGTRFVPYPGLHEWNEPNDDQRELRLRALACELELEVLR